MKNVILCFGAVISIAALVVATSPGQSNADAGVETKQIEHTVRLFLKSVKQRDVAEIRRVVSDKLIAIEAGESAKVGVIDTEDPQQLLPPPGNNDWDELTLKNFIASVSSTNASVATASFTLSRKLDDKGLKRIQAILNDPSIELRAQDRNRFERNVGVGSVDNDLFAMLARQDGEWRIVCLSLPR